MPSEGITAFADGVVQCRRCCRAVWAVFDWCMGEVDIRVWAKLKMGRGALFLATRWENAESS